MSPNIAKCPLGGKKSPQLKATTLQELHTSKVLVNSLFSHLKKRGGSIHSFINSCIDLCVHGACIYVCTSLFYHIASPSRIPQRVLGPWGSDALNYQQGKDQMICSSGSVKPSTIWSRIYLFCFMCNRLPSTLGRQVPWVHHSFSASSFWLLPLTLQLRPWIFLLQTTEVSEHQLHAPLNSPWPCAYLHQYS